jgi:hypothetical protein
MPITINGKSMQLIKKKEELEFQLDVIEKNISHVNLKLKDTSSSSSFSNMSSYSHWKQQQFIYIFMILNTMVLIEIIYVKYIL